MRGRWLGAGLMVLVLALGLTASVAQEMGKKSQAAAHRFAVNNALFVLYHEVGHLIIDQLRLPVLGREEDAADNIATWTMLTAATAQSHAALADAAYGWRLTGLAYESQFANDSLYGPHSLDQVRAFQIVCHMVGHDDRGFRAIAAAYGMDRFRQESCYEDWFLMDRSMRDLIRSHVTLKGNPGGIEITYQSVSGRLREAAEVLRASGILERVADEVTQKWPMRRRAIFNAKRCGEANAFYDPNTNEVIFCYELVQDFIELANKDIIEKGNFELAPGGSTRTQR